MMVVVWRFIGVFSCRFFDFIRLYLVDYRGITSFFLIVFWKIITILVYLHRIMIINDLSMKRLLLVAIMALSVVAGFAQNKERIKCIKGETESA